MHSDRLDEFPESDSHWQRVNHCTPRSVPRPVHDRTALGHAFLPFLLLGLGILIDYAVPGPERDAAVHQTLSGHENQVNSVAFASDGLALASTSQDRTIRLWSLKARRTETILINDASLTSVAYQPGGRTIATVSDEGTIALWDVSSGDRILELSGDAQARAVAFSPDGHALGSCDAGGRVRLWDPSSGKLLSVLHGDRGTLNTLAWSPDGKVIAAAGVGNRVQCWHLESRTRRSFDISKALAYILSISFSPDSKLLAVAGPLETHVTVWAVESGLERMRLIGQTSWASCVAFSGDGRFLASGSADGAVRLWEVNSKSLCCVFHEDRNLIKVVAFSPDNSLLAAAGNNATIQLWDVGKQARQVGETR